MKYDIAYTKANASDVAPLVGAWIEIVISTISRLEIIVAPLVGAWIEITISILDIFQFKSLLL